eukprot:3226220-Rhodomonas_salina.1
MPLRPSYAESGTDIRGSMLCLRRCYAQSGTALRARVYYYAAQPTTLARILAGHVDRYQMDDKGAEQYMGATKAGGVVGDVSFAFGMKHLYGARA